MHRKNQRRVRARLARLLYRIREAVHCAGVGKQRKHKLDAPELTRLHGGAVAQRTARVLRQYGLQRALVFSAAVPAVIDGDQKIALQWSCIGVSRRTLLAREHGTLQ